ncbi:MAG: SNF2-related protein, partial [Blautia marasmi]
DLPDKLEKTVYVKMEEEQKKIYDARVARLQMELSSQSEEDYKNQRIKYLAELMGLRQICCSPQLCYENYRGGSAKQE